MSYRDNLRPGSFVSPSGTEHFFKFNDLTRSKGKKASVSEILDSDESVAQDQGNASPAYPMDVFFTGEDYDVEADFFWQALSERYSPENPGILKHPRWGDVTVMPMSFSQSESFVSGAQVGKFNVEFRQTFKIAYPTTDLNTETEALRNINKMKKATDVDRIKKDAGNLAKLKNKITAAVKVISDSLKSIVETQEGAIAKFEAIQAGIDSVIDDIGTNLFNIVAATQTLMLFPGRIFDDTLAKINGYYDMIVGLIDTFTDEDEGVPEDRLNNAIMLELLAGMGSAALSEAALFTDYPTKQEASDGIAIVEAGYNTVNAAIENSVELATDVDMENSYLVDHNYVTYMQQTVKAINLIILTQSFDLKIEKRITLKEPSDMVTLCAKYYNSVENETIDFFLTTNELIGDEFIEISPGRELVFYG